MSLDLSPEDATMMRSARRKSRAAAFSVRAEVLSGGIIRGARGIVESWGAPDFSGADKSYWGKALDVSGHRRFCVVAR